VRPAHRDLLRQDEALAQLASVERRLELADEPSG
jgi:hypothetical protein